MSLPYLAVVIPAYNEEPRILPTLRRVQEYLQAQPYTWSVLVVSDGSSDQTEALVKDFTATDSRFSLLSYKPNRGKGYAVRKGMLQAEGELVLFSDADLAAPIEEVEKLIPQMKEHEVAIGSRPLKESKLEKRQPKLREMLGRGANFLIQILGVWGIHDTQCGFKLFRGSVAKDIFSRAKFDRFSFDIEALRIARDLGYTIAEVPIRWSHQEGSKVVLWRDVPRTFGDLIKLRMMGKKRRLERNES